MKTRELMIGDWVLLKSRTHSEMEAFNPYRIEDLTADYFALENEHAFYEADEGDELIPVPLTADMLERSGWIKREDYFCASRDKDNNIYYYPEDGSCYYYRRANGKLMCLFSVEGMRGIRSVHEFQNAMRFCGMLEFADNLKVNAL